MAPSVRDNSLLDLTKIAPLLCLGDDGDDELLDNLRNCDITNGLPDLGMWTTLDQSQLDAVDRILTKELAVVQGPPGTGKTYTSVTALDVVLRNRQARVDSPIIVAAQTNHALDLLLSHSMDRGARVLRVGGRTDNEAIAERTAFNLRRQIKQPDPAFGRLDKARRVNIEAIRALVRSAFPDDLLEPAELVKAGILTENQHKSLCDDECE
jgi:helicase required for RNAi-mediated heterochromatin assembly 1